MIKRTRFTALSVNHQDLMEVQIQGYCCLCQHKVPTVIHCLTDLSQWYYFKDEVKSSKLKISWYKSISEKELSLESHHSFLHPVVLDILTEQVFFP